MEKVLPLTCAVATTIGDVVRIGPNEVCEGLQQRMQPSPTPLLCYHVLLTTVSSTLPTPKPITTFTTTRIAGTRKPHCIRASTKTDLVSVFSPMPKPRTAKMCSIAPSRPPPSRAPRGCWLQRSRNCVQLSSGEARLRKAPICSMHSAA